MFQVVVASNILILFRMCLVSLPTCNLQIISGIFSGSFGGQLSSSSPTPEVFEETLHFDAAMQCAVAGYLAAFGLTLQSLFTYCN